jgi:hypothetical protein
MEWSSKTSVSFGVYDKQAPEYKVRPEFPQWAKWVPIKDPQFLYQKLKLALERCDDYVWLYMEGNDWMVVPRDQTGSQKDRLLPPAEEFVRAVAEAKRDAKQR